MAGKGVAQLQAEGDKARRKQVDIANKKQAAKDKAIAEKVASTPLNAEERAFCEKIAAKMNCGRHVEKPQSADILRYSKLRGRMEIPETSDGDVE